MKVKEKLTFMVTLPCNVTGVIPLMRRNSDCIGLPGDQAAKSTNQCIATIVSSKPNPALQISGFGLTHTPQMPLIENFALIMLRKLVLQLQDCFS